MKQDFMSGIIGTSLSAVGTATSPNDILQTISLICTILGAIITFIVVPLLNWYQRAKQDGKIDKKEIQEGMSIISDGIDSVKDELDDKGKE